MKSLREMIDIVEGAQVAYVVSYFEKITGEKGEVTVSAMSKDDAAEKAKRTVITHGYPIEVYHVERAYEVDESHPKRDSNKQWFDDINDWKAAVKKITYDKFEASTGRVFNGDELVAGWDSAPMSDPDDEVMARGWVKIEQDISEEATPEAVEKINKLFQDKQ